MSLSIATNDFLNQLTRDSSVAVVGNGNIEDAGPEIDSCSYVFRFNDFQLDGFGGKVGTKTSAWVTSGYKTIEARPNFEEALCPFAAYTIAAKYSRQFWPRTGTRLLFTRGNPHLDHFTSNCWEFPSTGFCFVALLQWMKFSDVRLFGFDGMSSGHYFNPGHGHRDHQKSRKVERGYYQIWGLVQ